jgi:succinate dehydrogenase / fumarate reductase membrane anchor subunit
MNMDKRNAPSIPAPSIHVMRSQLGRARGLGSAKAGLHHWWMQRITAIALLPLALYFVLSVLMLAGASRAEMAAFMAEPWNTVLYLCLIAALFYHLSLGLQAVIEDYVHNEAKRRGTLLVVNAIIVVLAVASAVSVLKLAF